MRVPEVLLSLTDQGVIDEVLRPLKSGKEAQVYLVRADGQERVAKVYKDALHRSFKQRAQYTEGRLVRNTRDQRAIDGRTRHGKAQEESVWKSVEMDVIYRLHAQGVRVPTPYNFIDGVLIMELVRGDDGHAAPRLSELHPEPEMARAFFDRLLREVINMLCAGIVHGDLSDYNVLIDSAGPVIIDFPQSVDASKNRNAKKLLVRDVDNLSAFLTRCVPKARRRPYGQEIWAAYEGNTLTPDFALTGEFRHSTKAANVAALLEEIGDAEKDERRRREALGEAAPRPRRREVIVVSAGAQEGRQGGRPRNRGPRAAAGGGQPAGRSAAGQGGSNGRKPTGDARGRTRGDTVAVQGNGTRTSDGEEAPKRRRRRRRGGSAKVNGSGQMPQQKGAEGGQASSPSPHVAAPTPEAGAGPSKARRRRRRGRRKGPGPQAGDATGSGRRTRTDGGQ